MQQFSDFVRSAGLVPREIYPDGKWHRCPTSDHPHKRNGSFKLASDGLIGWVQDFATMSEPLTWRPDKAYEAPKINGAEIARKKAEERRALARAMQGAREFYAGCKPLLNSHPYLEAHGLTVTGCYDLKVDSDGWLVVPVMIDRNVVSVQRISGNGEKRFWPEASVKAGSYLIERRGAQLTVLCEGLATGLAIFAATPTARVIVCFNAGNMGNMRIPRRGLAVVAADNDHATAERIGHNPGLVAAQVVADSLGCGVAAPAGIAGTDWCDWRNERVADRLATRTGGERETDIRRAVDAQIAAEMMRHAKFLRSE